MTSFYAFIDRKKAEERGINIDHIISPYGVWNSGLDRGDYAVFPVDATDTQEFKRYQSDPIFVKIVVSGN